LDAALEDRLRTGVKELRGVLGRQSPQARQIVQKLLSERGTLTRCVNELKAA
jgi:hypothetical protein